jgi:hypothetical protein
MATPAQLTSPPRRARLRLLQGRGSRTSAKAPAHSEPSPLRLVKHERREDSILVAGSDPQRRSTLLRELSERLPKGTRFEEAAATWEMLERAPSSRIVMLAGELDGSSPESVMHLLGNRHPLLPVLALSAPGAA